MAGGARRPPWALPAAAALAAAQLGGAAARSRLLKVTNQCPFHIRVQGTGGAAYSLTCSDHSDCPSGLVCDPSVDRPGGVKGGCFFQLPKPIDNGGSYDLPSGKSLNIQMPTRVIKYKDKSQQEQHQSWNGNIYASTGCKFFPGGGYPNCQTGICYPDAASQFGKPGVCEGSLGPDGPVTRVEMSLQQGSGNDHGSFDYYDVTMVDGVNLPVTVRPFNTDAASCPSSDASFCRYWCGAPGATNASHPDLAGCSWDFDAERDEGKGNLSPYLKWVDADLDGPDGWATASTPPRTLCSSDADCPRGEVCGFLGQTNSQDRPMLLAWGRQCGRQIGWITGNGACKWTSAWTKDAASSDGIDGFQAPYYCKQSAGVDTFQNLYGCDRGYMDSGYKNPASSSTCGCPDWLGLPSGAVTAPPCNMQCQPRTTSNASGSPWTNSALPLAATLKRGCPTAYSFPFDDATSTFQCRSTVGSENVASYEITFCPDGKTSLGGKDAYVCSFTSGCVRVPAATPGAYSSQSECEAACAPAPPPGPPPVWLCARSLQKCESAPAGTPGGFANYADCWDLCAGAPTPAPPGSSWLCGADGNCAEVPEKLPGAYPTQAECISSCSGPSPVPTPAPAEYWVCSARSGECVTLPERVPGSYESRSICVLSCWPPTPGSRCLSGVESDDGTVCCPLECGICGPVQCIIPDGERELCCPSRIRERGNFCKSDRDTGCRLEPRPEPSASTLTGQS
eukprot:TRINITY_DN133_c2_g1_i1.p1 TRINITY_DN133_c2_g1~~TRINITY_DN133_c2_g1_i1.p1  ORF type:complete len:735 (+),score=184.55 TRINITY_DN133_c2_g1_i1:94-2298(+)